MSYSPKKFGRSDGVSKLVLVLTVLVMVFVAVVAGYSSHAAGVQNGKEQMQPALNDTKQQLEDMRQRVVLLTEPTSKIDPLVPPSHNSGFYAKQLKDNVDKATSKESREDAFWSSVCTAQKELVGVPMDVFHGPRADTFREFSKVVGQHYMVLVLSKKVPFRAEDGPLYLIVHMQQAMNHTDCS